MESRSSNETPPIPTMSAKPGRKRPRRGDAVDEKIIEFLNKEESQSTTYEGDKHFVMSLLPHLQKLDDDTKIDIQIKIMQLVRDEVKKKSLPQNVSNHEMAGTSYQAMLNESFSLQSYTNL